MTEKKPGRGIGEWPETERPRERLLSEGAESLSDSQLLAILLRVGRQEASAVKVGMEVLERIGGIFGLLHCSVEELCAIPGVGLAKAAQLKAAVEVGKRAVSAPLTTGMHINSSADLFKHYHARLRDLRHEIFAVVLLDAKNQVIRDVTISEGSLTLSIVHPREVFIPAMRASAAAVIFLHNHPSGDPTPSQEDRVLTARLVSAGSLLGIQVLDHLIVGDGRYVSFADQGWLSGEASPACAVETEIVRRHGRIRSNRLKKEGSAD